MVTGLSTRRLALAVCVLVSVVLVAGPAVGSDHRGQGIGRFKVNPLAEVQVTDGTIASLVANPTTLDPGPRAFDNNDRFRFNTRYTNTRSVFLLDVTTAQNDGGGTSLLIQGVSHQVAAWIFVRQGEGSRFVTVETTGTYDPDASAYTAPGGFTKSSQGTVTLRSYDQTTPADGGTTRTINWIYDAGSNDYWLDSADKDFSNGNGETRVAPISKAAASTYTFTVDTNGYGIGSVAGAGSNYVPTLNVGWVKTPGVGGGHDLDVYVLLDFPAGAPSDSYSYTVRGTIHDTI